MGRHFDRGQALFDLGRYREAIESYRAELAENPDSAVVHAMLAASMLNLNRLRECKASVHRAIELAPEMAYGHYVLSVLHQRCRRLAEAEAAIAEAIRLERTPESFFHWAVVANERGKMLEALAATAEALRLDPGHNRSILLRGKLLARSGKLDEAHGLFTAALAHNPEDAAAHHALGSLRLERGDAAAALGMLREARRLDPIRANDGQAIALAYGRMIEPLRTIDRAVLRWPLWGPKRQWAFFTALTAAVTIGGYLAGVNLERMKLHPAWTVACVVLANYLVLPYSLNLVATTAGYIALRREFRPRWYALAALPLMLFPMAWAHGAASLVGLGVSFPFIAVPAGLFAASFPLLRESMRVGATRATGYICLPIFFLLIILGTLGVVMTDLGEGPGGLVFTAALFGVAYFSDNLARWASSWRLRRSVLLE